MINYHILVLGAPDVGKTSLCRFFVKDFPTGPEYVHTTENKVWTRTFTPATLDSEVEVNVFYIFYFCSSLLILLVVNILILVMVIYLIKLVSVFLLIM